MARDGGRTSTCSAADAGRRQQRAFAFLEAARLLVVDAETDPDLASVSAALAVLAGIAAADAACCGALGRRSRGQDHRQATTLVAQIVPDGKEAAAVLKRLLDLKDEAHYGFYNVGGADLRSALRQAEKLVTFADTVLRR